MNKLLAIAVLTAALLLGAGGTAHAVSMTDVSGNPRIGYKVTWSDGYVDNYKPRTVAVAKCANRRTVEKRKFCRAATREWFRSLKRFRDDFHQTGAIRIREGC